MDSNKGSVKEHPSAELAHEFIIPSYNWMLTRLAAVEGRIHNLLTLCVVTTSGFPLVVVGLEGESQHLNGNWAFAAFGCFGLTLVLSLSARLWGKIELVNPSKLTDAWTSISKDEYWKASICHAGKDYIKNRNLIALKSYLTDIAVVTFVAEVILWAIWAKNVLSA